MNQLGAICLNHLITIRLLLEKDFRKKKSSLQVHIKKMVDILVVYKVRRERGHFATLDKNYAAIDILYI